MPKSANTSDVLEAVSEVIHGGDALKAAERLADMRYARQRLESVINAALVLQAELELVESMIEDAVGCGSPRGWILPDVDNPTE